MLARIFRRTSHHPLPFILLRSHLLPPLPPPPPTTQLSNPPAIKPFFRSIPITFSSFSSPHIPTPNVHSDADLQSDTEGDDSGDDIGSPRIAHQLDDEMLRDVTAIITSLADFSTDPAGAKRRLEQCGVVPVPELVAEVLSRLRNDWGAAFTFFLWAGNSGHQGYSHSVREFHSMIAILAKMRRFDTAWTLVGEMKGSSLVTPQTLLILIRRYAAIHDVAKAINTFYALKRFGFSPSIEDFHGLLSALCRYKNVEDAEHLLLCNEKSFSFETKSFNIILNGWCSVLVNLRESKRFWKDMDRRGIAKDAVSFGSMISCYSKAGNLKDVLKLFDRMKEDGVLPDRKVYNAVIFALGKHKCMDEAKRLVKTMEEKGVSPNAVTFNSLIRPLCKARQIDDARLLFEEMWQRGISPSIRTFHSFFHVLRTEKEVFELLDRMKRTGCQPVIDTYIMLIRKLCRWRQHQSVFKLWDEMIENGLLPDRSAYIVLIHGLFLNGKLEEASKYYDEMKEKGFVPEPKTEEMIQTWLSGKETSMRSGMAQLDGKRIAKDSFMKKGRDTSNVAQPHFLKQPEMRSVTRERGFSLW